MRTLLNDLRYAVRTLLRAPLFTSVALATLALGIGANTAVFSVIDGVLLRPAPVDAIDRLMMVWETDRNSGTSHEPASVPDFLDFRRASRSFADLAAVMGGEVALAVEGADPVRLAGVAASERYLPMLGVRPTMGRLFTAADDRPGAANVVLISERLWRDHLGGDPRVVGRALRIDDVPHTVVGVVGEDAEFGLHQVHAAADYGRAFAERGGRARVDVWRPLRADPEALPRSTHPIFVLGRLAPGAGAERAQAELAAIAARLERDFPENAARGVNVEPLRRVVFGPARPALVLLLGAVALLLLIACANVASLLLARGSSRAREFALRASLGAGPARMARQFLVESLVLVVAGAALGVVVALVGLDLLLALAPGDIPRLSAVGVDLRVLTVTLAVTAAVGVAFGMIPLLQSRRLDLQAALKGRSATDAHGGRDGGRLRSLLVVAELALAVVLTVGAGLLVKSFWQLYQVDPGFRAEGVLKAEFNLPQSRYAADFSKWPDWPAHHRFVATLIREVSALPGVQSASVAASHPLASGFTNSFAVVGREAEAEDWPEIALRQVAPGYFRTLGVPVVAGRAFESSDDAAAPRVMVVNAAAVRRFFPRGDAIGSRIRLYGLDWSVVGVVGDERFHGVAAEAPPAVYVATGQAPITGGSLLVRTSGDPAALARPVADVVRRVDPGLAVFGLEPLDVTLSQSLGQRRFTMLLLVTFAGVAVLLAVVGVYGVLGYLVARRTPELGIRRALGAPQREVVGLVARQALVLAALGIGLGLVGAVAATRLMRGLVWGVSTVDPLTYGGVALGLAAAAALASSVPALRAARIDPMVALRAE